MKLVNPRQGPIPQHFDQRGTRGSCYRVIRPDVFNPAFRLGFCMARRTRREFSIRLVIRRKDAALD